MTEKELARSERKYNELKSKRANLEKTIESMKEKVDKINKKREIATNKVDIKIGITLFLLFIIGTIVCIRKFKVADSSLHDSIIILYCCYLCFLLLVVLIIKFIDCTNLLYNDEIKADDAIINKYSDLIDELENIDGELYECDIRLTPVELRDLLTTKCNNCVVKQNS